MGKVVRTPAPQRAGNTKQTRAEREISVLADLARLECTDPQGFAECLELLANLVAKHLGESVACGIG